MMMMIMMTMTMMVMMMMVNICLRTCKTPDIKEIDQQLHKKANPEKFKTIPGLEIEANPDPENPGIPGFLQNPVPKIPVLKLLIPLGPGLGQSGPGADCPLFLGRQATPLSVA